MDYMAYKQQKLISQVMESRKFGIKALEDFHVYRGFFVVYR